MTRDEIFKMPAGKRMNKLIAENVMKEKSHEHGEIGETSAGDPYCTTCGLVGSWSDDIFGDDPCIKDYSTRIKEAYEVTEEFDFVRITKSFGLKGVVWIVKIKEEEVFEKTLPLAICRAALLSVMELDK